MPTRPNSSAPRANGASKRWVFTLNNYSPHDQDRLRALSRDPVCSYLIFGREVGDNGTPHLQGFIILSARKRLSQVKALVGGRAHLEVARGSPAEASAYCEKEEDYEKFGELPARASARS